MKPKPDPNELIRAVLDEIASPDFRADTLDKTLAYARRHRRFRKTVGLTACALVPLLILAGFLLLRSNPETQLAEHQPIPPPPDQSVTIAGTSIRILTTDEELFAMFPNRPIAIIGPPDSPQVLFLDELK